MQKFRDVLSRWERKELSAMEAGELLGCSERQFRRYRRRYEEEGLAGLADRRLGKASLRRVPVDKLVWMLGEYRTHHLGWNVKHFHEHIRQQHGFRWGYTWTKTQRRSCTRPVWWSARPGGSAPSQTAAQAVRRDDAASGWQPVCVAQRRTRA
jgi:hypothetical protein